MFKAIKHWIQEGDLDRIEREGLDWLKATRDAEPLLRSVQEIEIALQNISRTLTVIAFVAVVVASVHLFA